MGKSEKPAYRAWKNKLIHVTEYQKSDKFKKNDLIKEENELKKLENEMKKEREKITAKIAKEAGEKLTLKL